MTLRTIPRYKLRTDMTRTLLLPLAVLLAAVVFVASPALADTVVTTSGARLVGKIVEETDDAVTIRTRAGLVTVTAEEIESVEHGGPTGGADDLPVAPPKEPAPPPPPPRAEPKPKPAAPKPPAPPAPVAPKESEPKEAEPKPAALDLGGEDQNTLLAAVRGPSRERRVAALERLAETELGRAEAAKELAKERAKREKALVSWFGSRKEELRPKLAELVKLRRKTAYDFIMDPNRYPDENHGAAAQPQVDELVDLLRRAFESPYYEVKAAVSDVKELAQALKVTLEDAEKYAGAAPALPPEGEEPPAEDAGADPGAYPVAATFEEVEAALAAKVAKLLAISEYAVDSRDRQIMDESRSVLASNKTVKTTLDAEERACVDETNRYRMLFGLKALKIDERLVQAARKHSVEMVALGYFDHSSPVPENATPEMRCRREGATFNGENIARGVSTGEGAFRMWYTSAPHHRNILTPGHVSIGIGADSSFWTQNFGLDVAK